MEKTFKRLSLLPLVLLLIVRLTACDNDSNNDNNDAPQTLAVHDMAFELADTSAITVHHFSLGALPLEGATWDAESDVNSTAYIPAPLDGIIAVPEGDGAHQLVLLLHGNTLTDGISDPVYAGFDFLVAQLAAEGYIAISINIMVDYGFEFDVDGKIVTGESMSHEWAYALFNTHIEALEQANAGSVTAHGIDLTGRVLTEEIHLIGHSRGGMVADQFYRLDRDAGISRIRTIMRVGTMTQIIDSPYEHPNIPLSILLAQFDGDVTLHPGQVVFDQILAEASNTSFAQITYLQGGNHNFFNRFFEEDDRIHVGGEDAALFLRHQDTWTTRQEQEDFFKRYVVAFLGVATHQISPFSTFDSTVAQPTSMFGFPVRASTYLPGSRRLEVAEQQASGQATVGEHVQRWGSGSLFVHPMMDPGTDELTLTSLAWTGADGKITFTPQIKDFSGAQALSFYLAVDSSDERNPAGESQSFSLVLTDFSGKTQTLIIPPETAALYFHVGEKNAPSEYLDFDTWNGTMPLGELRVPLSYFTNINLENIESITFLFDQTPSGAIMLSDIFITP